ncbi:MAG: insulinase family protein, partial [Phycisphaerales bacterium JB038]
MRRMTTCLACIGLALLSPLSALAQEYQLSDPLPQRPDLVTGELDNGLRYLVLEHAVPPGRLSMYLHVDAGSLNESEAQRGLAHFLEHLAFNGSENFPPGEVIRYFESLGLTFGQHQNAFTSFDQTVYMLSLPDVEPATVADGMLFLADVAGRLLLDPTEIENERQVILNEFTASKGPEMRLFEEMLPAMFPGSRLAERLPIGLQEVIENADRETFVNFYETWYTPGRMTLLVVGDAEPQRLIEQIESEFGSLLALPTAPDVDPGVRPYAGQSALVATDPELTDCSVQLLSVAEAPAPAQTVGEARAELVQMLGVMALNRRLEDKISEGGAPYLSAGASQETMFAAAQLAAIEGSGEPADWQAMLQDLIEEMQAAREHGFSALEIEKARREMLAGIEQMAARESTMPAQFLLMMMMMSISEGTPVTGADQTLAILQQLLPEITPQEVAAEFKTAFDPDFMTFLVTMPATEDQPAPTETDVLAAAREAIGQTVQARADQEVTTSLLDESPERGFIVGAAVHPATGVLSYWLDNGVRCHYLFSDYEEENCTTTVTMAGGNLEETPETKALTEAALLAFRRPAAQTRSSNQIRDFLLDKKINLRASAGEDAITLRVTGDPVHMTVGFHLLHLLLTEPVIEEPVFDQWKRSQLQDIRRRQTDAVGLLRETAREVLYSEHESQRLMLTAADIEAVTLEDAQAWLEQLIATAPMEVTVVGDIGRRRGTRLPLYYIASLPERERLTEATLDSLRDLELNEPPYRRTVEYQTLTPKAAVLTGFFGPDADNLRDRRLMDLAAQICDSRMIER